MPIILQDQLSDMPWMHPRGLKLPGLQAIPLQDWLWRDACFDAQTAYKMELLAVRIDDIFQVLPGSESACTELLAMVCRALKIPAPDGEPLSALAALTQEDWILLDKPAGSSEHVIIAGLLGFPASWTLSEKMGKPLTRVHKPVPGYAGDIARRVQRIFDGLKPGRAVCRHNVLIYDTPELHHPLKEGEHRLNSQQGPHFIRVERQTLRRLPNSDAVAFGIHTSVVPATALLPEAFEKLAVLRPVIRAADGSDC